MKYVIVVAAILCVSGLAWSQGKEAGQKKSRGRRAISLKTPKDLQELLKYTGDSLHLVSAHRGGPRKGFPENCIATFESTLRHTFSMMEVDPRYTKDGAIVLHHDATLERTTNGKGAVADCTLKELKQLRLRDPEGNLTEHSIPTLDEALKWARGKTILVLDQKDVPVKARIKKIEEHRAEAYAMLIVYRLEDVKLCYALSKNIMMEVMISSRRQLDAFNKSGVPWSNIVAFVGHSPPQDPGLCKAIHAKGTSCIAGTSRNLDRQFTRRKVKDIKALEKEYRALIEQGADIIADRPSPRSRTTALQGSTGAFIEGEILPGSLDYSGLPL